MNARSWNGGGRRVHLQEVGTRDGLQNEGVFVPTDDKVALVDALSALGYAKIEVTAFVSPKAIPALRDAETVMREITRRPGITYTALVPNVRGAERAVDARVDEMNLVMSASEAHNQANLRMSREQSFDALAGVARIAHAAPCPVNVSLSCVFGCPIQGEIDVDDVWTWAGRFVDGLGARGITLCDTTGMAHPAQVHDIVTQFRRRFPQTELTLHFHNTRGMGLANVLAALDAGADRFDASLGGIGGCPYAPGATGNVCTEEVVHALNWMGWNTGIELDPLLAAAQTLERLVGHPVPGQILRAGDRLRHHPAPRSEGASR